MAAITDLNDLIQILASTGATETIFWTKAEFISGTTSIPNTVQASSMSSLWLWDGIPSRGIEPTVAELCTNTTIGGLKITNPTINKEKYLIQHGFFTTDAISVLLYDRLAHSQSIDPTFSGTTIINTPTLDRYSGTSSAGNMLLMEIYQTSALGASRQFEIKYTNQDGISGQSSFFSVCIFPPLASGDTGVRSIESVAPMNVTTVGGSFGLSIIRPLSLIHTPQGRAGGIPTVKDFISGLPGMPKIENNACLAYIAFNAYAAGTSVSPENFYGFITMIEK
jgi:hypothetical protein